MLIVAIMVKIRSPASCQSLISSIQNEMIFSLSIQINHVHREANFDADFLFHYAYGVVHGIHTFQLLPDGIGSWLSHDYFS